MADGFLHRTLELKSVYQFTMSIYSGNITGVASHAFGTILVILPKALDPGSYFVVLVLPFSGSQQAPLQLETSRFDVAIESSSSLEDSENKAIRIFGTHLEYRFSLEVSDASLTISVALSFGVVAPATLQLLATYPADTVDNLVLFAPRATPSDPKPSIVVILPRDATNASPFLALSLPPSAIDHPLHTVHQGSLSGSYDDNTTDLRIRIAFNGGDSFSGAVENNVPSLQLIADGPSNSALDLLRLERSRISPINLYPSGALTTIQNDVDEIVRCSLRETGTPDWQSTTEASVGFGVGGVSMLTASATVAAALPASVPVVLGVIGLILASRSLYAAIKPGNPDVARALYHNDRLSRQSETNNDVLLMRAHMIGGDLRLVVNTYEVLEVGGQTSTVTAIIQRAEVAKTVTTLFNFVLAVPQKLSLCRAIAIPSLVPSGVSPTLNGDERNMSGGVATFTKNGTATYYAPSDLFDTLPKVIFKYSQDQSSYMIQQGNHVPGKGNTVIPLPTASYSVLKLSNMVVSGAGAGTRLSGSNAIAAINDQPDFWAYSTLTPSHADTSVVAYKTPGYGTELKPSPGTNTYFVMKDWSPYQAFVPAS